MKLNARLAANLITVLLLGVLTVGWVVTRLVGGGVLEGSFTVVADFAQSGGVFTNQEVTYRGVLVGRVGELSLNDDGVDIELSLDPEWEGRIPADLVASVQSKSAVGEQFVNLTPLDTDGPALEDGDRVERSQTRLPVDFQDLLDSLDAVLADVPPEKTRRLVQSLARGLEGRGEEIGRILTSLGELSDAFASVAPEQQRLLSSATRAGSAFLATKDEFSRAIRAADDVLEGLGDEPDELEALLVSNDRLARAGLRLLDRRGGDLAAGIGSLADFVDYQLSERAEIGKALDYVPQFLHAVEDASVPWTSPDGRSFYRIRIGVVHDNVPATWPCKYEVPEEYERFPHVRGGRRVVTSMRCIPRGEDEEARAAAASLVSALRHWSAARTAETAAAMLAAAGSTGPSVEGPGLMWPLDGPVTSGFGPRWGRSHQGIDIDGVTGDPVVAAAAGEVIFAGPYAGYGNAVAIDHGDGLRTLYAHLSAFGVRKGNIVAKGQVIGLVGCTGHCFGDHLHFEVLVNGVPVDPLVYLPGGPLFLPLAPSEIGDESVEADGDAGPEEVPDGDVGPPVDVGGPPSEG